MDGGYEFVGVDQVNLRIKLKKEKLIRYISYEDSYRLYSTDYIWWEQNQKKKIR